MKAFLFMLWQCTFGIVQTLAGFIVLLCSQKTVRFRYHGAVVTVWQRCDSVSLGLFLFVACPDPAGQETADALLKNSAFARLLLHEYGHAVQSLLLGPLYLPVVGLPSALWGTLPCLRRKRLRENRSYYSFYTERWANRLGERVLQVRA